MNVEWTKQAERALDEAADYVFEEFGWDACDRFLFRCIMPQSCWKITLTSAQKSLCSQNAK